MSLRHQPENVAALADHDLGIEGKPACQFGAESRPGDWPPDHEGARRADVNGIEVLQLFGERGRPEGPVTADVDASQKNHERHVADPIKTAWRAARRSACSTRCVSPRDPSAHCAPARLSPSLLS